MIDWGRIAGFDWDEGNRRKNEKHGVSQAEAEQTLTDDHLLVTEDLAHSRAEARFQALGRTQDQRLLHVTFTLRQDRTLIRIISARDMNRKERVRYEKQT